MQQTPRLLSFACSSRGRRCHIFSPNFQQNSLIMTFFLIWETYRATLEQLLMMRLWDIEKRGRKWTSSSSPTSLAMIAIGCFGGEKALLAHFVKSSFLFSSSWFEPFCSSCLQARIGNAFQRKIFGHFQVTTWGDFRKDFRQILSIHDDDRSKFQEKSCCPT